MARDRPLHPDDRKSPDPMNETHHSFFTLRFILRVWKRDYQFGCDNLHRNMMHEYTVNGSCQWLGRWLGRTDCESANEFHGRRAAIGQMLYQRSENETNSKKRERDTGCAERVGIL